MLFAVSLLTTISGVACSHGFEDIPRSSLATPNRYHILSTLTSILPVGELDAGRSPFSRTVEEKATFPFHSFLTTATVPAP